jgi:hypothetical protein
VILLVLWQDELIVPNSAPRVPDLEGELADPVGRLDCKFPVQPLEYLIWKVSLLVLWQTGLLVPNSDARVPDLEGELAGLVAKWTVSSQFSC